MASGTSWFGRKLRGEMDSQKMSTRELAKRWRPGSHESARRSLIRYLRNGTIPGPDIRGELADALGVDRERLEPDDEEDALLSSDLSRALLAVIRKELARAS